ncbi:MAG TPA: hypothetical protein VNZ58_13995 [Thermomicrobiales bacterium]|nr:hypothetical protein [Thermomicrobiales bacterium]
MDKRGRFDQEIYFLTDQHLRNANRNRMLLLARDGRPDPATVAMLRLRVRIGATLESVGLQLQRPREQTPPVPLLQSRILSD